MSKMSLEEIVNRILSSRSDLERKEILEMIEKKKNDRIAELLAEKMKQYENQ